MLGPTGVRARPHPWWTPVRLLVAVAVLTGALTAVVQVPCATGSAPRWFDPPRDRATLCASDLPTQYLQTGLADGRVPLGDGGGRYEPSGLSAPVALVAAGTASVARAVTGADDVAGRDDVARERLAQSRVVRHEAVVYTALAGLLLLVASWAVVALVGGSVVRARRRAAVPPVAGEVAAGVPPGLWWVAAAPMTVVGALTGWDLLPVLLAVAGFVAWRSGRAVAGGVLLGLAVASAGWTVAVLVAVASVALRRADRAASTTLASAFVTWLVVAVAGFVLTAGASTTSVADNVVAAPDPGSTWSLLSQAGLLPSPGQVGLVTACLWLVVLVGVLVLGQTGRRPLDPAVLVVVALVGLLLVSARYSPAQALWLLPFVVLAHHDRAAVVDVGIWQAAELFGALTLAWDVLGVTDRVDGANPLAVVGVILRVLGELWIAGAVLFSARSPSAHHPESAEWRKPDPEWRRSVVSGEE